VLAHQIAGSEPAVAFCEHVVQDLPVGLRLTRIALEPLTRLRCILHNLADDLARLVDIALDTETALVAHRLLRLWIKAHDFDGKAGRDPPGQPAYRALLVVKIEQGDVAFGCGIELDDLRDLEAPPELRPHVGAQPISAGQAQVMRALLWARRRVDEIAAKLADILEAGAVPAHDVVPEFARRKFVPDHH